MNLPVVVGNKHEVSADDRRSLMMSISALLPDHNARLHALQVHAVASIPPNLKLKWGASSPSPFPILKLTFLHFRVQAPHFLDLLVKGVGWGFVMCVDCPKKHNGGVLLKA